MKPVYTFDIFVTVTNKYGESCSCPAGYGDDDIEDDDTVEVHEAAWWCCLSANGYMDQTDWMGPYASEEEAREELTRYMATSRSMSA